MASLTHYRRKRNFRRTPEPSGGGKRAKKRHPGPASPKPAETGGLYVIQKHDASRLHYDLRLELDGALKSWAVPKGPSLDPSEKRLAVQVEDHPIEYGDFEGTIPKGEYGGGTVMLWDRGRWTPIGDPRRDYENGKLTFTLNGEKLRGQWSLVRMHGTGKDTNWLLIKSKDAQAKAQGDVLKQDRSVASGRTMNQIAAGQEKQTKASGAKKSPATAKPSTPKQPVNRVKPGAISDAEPSDQPKSFKPQLPVLVNKVPSGDQWLHETKFDGYRILCFIEAGHVRLVSRNGLEWTRRFPAVAKAAAELPVKNAILDGEVVVFREDGTTDFQALQNALRGTEQAVIRYFIFDLPHCEGYDLTRLPLIKRKELLKHILADQGEQATLAFSEHVSGQGDRLFKAACMHHLEGVVSKRMDAPYEQRRSASWTKVKCVLDQEFVIGGFTDPGESREGFGSLLLGYYTADGQLSYCGRVGTGFDTPSLKSLHRQLVAKEVPQPAFANPPRGAAARSIHWLRPHFVANVQFRGWTREGILRQASFKGLREDKRPQDVVREQPVSLQNQHETEETVDAESTRPAKSAPAKKTHRQANPAVASAPGKAAQQVAGVAISNANRVLFPEQGITKGDLAGFYESIAEWVLPHVTGRPLSLLRCPQGRQGQCFFQKHLTGKWPPGLLTVSIREKNATRDYPMIEDLAGLVGLVQMGTLEIHPWGCRADELEKPDLMIFDLDPGPKVEWTRVIAAARELRQRLSGEGLESFVKTSGGKGLHVVVPLQPRADWEALKAYAKAIAEQMVHDDPAHYVANMRKELRTGKIFIDYLRNSRGATCVAAYTVRARQGAPVSVPLAWEQLTASSDPAMFDVRNLRQRLARRKDPWRKFFELHQTLPKPKW